jgi:hypothetical protein
MKLRGSNILRSWVGFGFFILITALAGEIRAQKSDADEYRTLVGRAVHEYSLEHWADAIELFQKAHALKPSARTLRGMGLAAFEEQRYLDAYRWLSDAMKNPVQPLTRGMREEIRQVLARVQEFMGYFKLNSEPANIRFEVDGQPALVEDGMIKFESGRRFLVATADGYEPLRRTVEVNNGDNGILGLKLERVPGTSVSVPPEVIRENESGQSETEGDSDSRSSGASILPWTLVGVGVAATAAGATLVALMLKDISKVKNADGTTPELEDAQNRVPLYSSVGFVAAGVGLTTLIFGAGMLISGDEPAEKTSATRKVQLEVGLSTVSLSGEF